MKPCNVIFIVLDTMREDGIQPYSDSASTPNMLKFAQNADVYHNVISTSSWTLPSHISMFTGLYPLEHGIDYSTMFEKTVANTPETRDIFLPRRLKHAGYNTYAYSANNVISEEFGFSLGFDRFVNDSLSPPSNKTSIYREFGDNDREIVSNLLKKMRVKDLLNFYSLYRAEKKFRKRSGFPQNQGAKEIIYQLINDSFASPLFLFINMMEMHEPYESEVIRNVNRIKEYVGKDSIPEDAADAIKKEYYARAEIVDENVGKILDLLKAKNLFDDSLIIIVSDHGQSFGEKDWYFHQQFLYDELVKVPLIIKYPSIFKEGGNIHKDEKEYYSVADLYDLVVNFCEGHGEELRERNTVFADLLDSTESEMLDIESFRHLFDTSEKLARLTSAKEAIFHDGYKAVFESTGQRLDEFTYNGKELSVADYENILREIVEEAEIYIGNAEFSFPEEWVSCASKSPDLKVTSR